MGRPYYDRIAKQWHDITGYHGGSFKKYILNDFLLEKIKGIDGLSILELGAGNGYFMPKVFKAFSGQRPAGVIVTDLSAAVLRVAEREFRRSEVEYRRLDIRRRFPFDNATIDLIVATMVVNELSTAGAKSALTECHRVLRDNGRLLVTVTHPAFIQNLKQRGELLKLGSSLWTMPARGPVRVPVAIRSEQEYDELITETGLRFSSHALYPDQRVLNERPGLKSASGLPLALVYDCLRTSQVESEPAG